MRFPAAFIWMQDKIDCLIFASTATLLKIPMIGIIDNMSYSISPSSDKKIHEFTAINLEDEIGLKVLGSVPRTREVGNFSLEKSSILFEPIYNEILKIIQ